MRIEDVWGFIVLILVSVLIILGIILTTHVIFQEVFADSIHIDDYRPIGKEITIQINSFGIIDNRYSLIQTNVTISVNNMTFTGETNKYGFISFPIKLTDNIFEAGSYPVLIQIGENTYQRILHVISISY